MKNIPIPLTEKQMLRLRELLPLVVSHFVRDGENHVSSEGKHFFEICWEIPRVKKDKDCSLGFYITGERRPLYWSVPRVSPTKDKKYLSKGFKDTSKIWLSKYVYIPKEFWDRTFNQQVSWLVDCVKSLLKEDKELRGN